MLELPVVVNAAHPAQEVRAPGYWHRGTGTDGTPSQEAPGLTAPGPETRLAPAHPRWPPSPPRLVGAKKLKSLTPKVCKITGKGKKAKVTVLKSGKCKLTGKKGKKKVKASFRVNK